MRAWLVIDGVIFGTAAAFNFGFGVSVGHLALRFEEPIWQAGTGEAVIALLLLAAAVTRRRVVAWIAFAASVLGIAFGLASRRVVGEARDIHAVLVPVAVVLLVLLVTVGRSRSDRFVPG
jgi:hypothetical protein